MRANSPHPILPAIPSPRPSQACPSCEHGLLARDTRDVAIRRRGLEAVVPMVAGLFCDSCGEIDFDDSTDSGERFAQTGDLLVTMARLA